jgi:hypothetical protein
MDSNAARIFEVGVEEGLGDADVGVCMVDEEAGTLVEVALRRAEILVNSLPTFHEHYNPYHLESHEKNILPVHCRLAGGSMSIATGPSLETALFGPKAPSPNLSRRSKKTR